MFDHRAYPAPRPHFEHPVSLKCDSDVMFKGTWKLPGTLGLYMTPLISFRVTNLLGIFSFFFTRCKQWQFRSLSSFLEWSECFCKRAIWTSAKEMSVLDFKQLITCQVAYSGRFWTRPDWWELGDRTNCADICPAYNNNKTKQIQIQLRI
jgi:hypothetical protein